MWNGYQKSPSQRFTVGRVLQISKSQFWLHSEGGLISIFTPYIEGKKNELLIKQFSIIFIFNCLKYIENKSLVISMSPKRQYWCGIK